MPKRRADRNATFSAQLALNHARSRCPRFEQLEGRYLLSASSIDGRPFVDIGPSDNVAWDQPRVTVQYLTQDFPDGSDPPSNIIVGPNTFNTWLLDTGANTTLVFKTAVDDMREFEPRYQIGGLYAEIGIGGTSLFDISIPYRFDFSDNADFERNTLRNVSSISKPGSDISMFGPWGITGMPAMTERVTSLDFTPWTDIEDFNLFMVTNFANDVPEPLGPRYTISVNNQPNFAVEAGLIEGNDLPMWADIPFFTSELKNNDIVTSGNFLFDTGAQVSIFSSQLAFNLGLDTNLDGILNELDANFARMETIGGISGTVQVPVFLIDEVHVQTEQGSDLVWTDLQWIVLDIIEGIDGVFGFDNMTSGWIEAFGVAGQSGYLMQSHLDFRGWEATGEGKIHFDVNPELHTRIDPNGPGATVVESGGITSVSETGVIDTYQIWLNQPPAANVTVSFVGSANQATAHDAANPSNSFITFTPENWNVPQTVVVEAINDGAQEGYHRVFMRNVASSADPKYDGVGMPRLSVSITDDDFAGVMLLPTDGETVISEDGLVDFYDIVLTKAPLQDVAIGMEHVSQQLVAVSEATGANTVFFTPANWNIPQRIRVTAVDDDLAEGNTPAFITHRITTSDEEYQQAFVLQERVMIIDNDVDSAPPTIQHVWAGSPEWSAAFIDTINGTTTGGGMELVPAGAVLPWNDVDHFVIEFSKDVTEISNATVELRDSSGVVPSTVTYDQQTRQATVQLNAPRGMSKLRLSISDQVKDTLGNQLDGDKTNGAGGHFNLRFDILPGDGNNDGRVNGSDLSSFSQAFNTQPGQSSYNPRADWNADGRVNGSDLSVFSALFNQRLDTLTEPGNSFGSGGRSWQDDRKLPGLPATASAWLTTPYIAWDEQGGGQWDEAQINQANPFMAAALRRRDALLAAKLAQQTNVGQVDSIDSQSVGEGNIGRANLASDVSQGLPNEQQGLVNAQWKAGFLTVTPGAAPLIAVEVESESTPALAAESAAIFPLSIPEPLQTAPVANMPQLPSSPATNPSLESVEEETVELLDLLTENLLNR